jgi:hypothetical protein
MSDPITTDVWPPAPTVEHLQDYTSDPVLKVLEYRYQSTLLVFLAGVITLGFYQLVWLFIKSRSLKNIWPENGVAPEAFTILLLLDVVSTVGAYFHPSPVYAWSIFDVAWTVVFITYIFKLRNRFNILLGNNREAKYWMGGLGTFFLGPAYMNYKLNRAIEAAQGLQGGIA